MFSINPSSDIVKNPRGLVEVVLRGITIVRYHEVSWRRWPLTCTSYRAKSQDVFLLPQVVSLTSAVVASVYLGILANLCNFMVTTGKQNPDVPVGSCEVFMYQVSSEGFESEGSLTFDRAGPVCVVLVLSVLLIIYQILAILQLFLNVEVLNIMKTCCKSTCTVFSIIVSSKFKFLFPV